MAITRQARRKNFTVLGNGIFDDNHLSFQAIGLLSYLLSKPDNWSVNVSHLIRVTERTEKKTGKDGVYSILNELQKVGYASYVRHADGSTDWMITDEPQNRVLDKPDLDKPDLDKPDLDKPDLDKPDLDYTDVLIRTESSTRTEYLVNTDNYCPVETEQVFKYWKEHLNHSKAVLDDVRRKRIAKAFDLGFTVRQCLQAIAGCKLTPHNMGKNKQHQVYDGIHLIFKNADQIERFIRNYENPVQQPLSVTNAEAVPVGELLDESERYVVAGQDKF